MCLMYPNEPFVNYHKTLLVDLAAFQDYTDTNPKPYYYFDYFQRRIDGGTAIEAWTSAFAVAVNHAVLNDAVTNGGRLQHLKFSDVTGPGKWQLIRESMWIYDIDMGLGAQNRFEQIYRGPDGRYYAYIPSDYGGALYSVSDLHESGGAGYHENYWYDYLSAQEIAVPHPTGSMLYPERLLVPGIASLESGLPHYDTQGAFGYVSSSRPYHAEPVPEPSTMLLLASGLAGLGGVMWRRRKS